MNRKIPFRFSIQIAMFFALASFFSVRAQQPAAAPIPTIPIGPLIRSAPANSRWIIEIKYPTAKAKAENEVTPKQAPPPEPGTPRVKKILATRSGAIACEMIFDEAGRKTEKWYANNEQYTRKVGSVEFYSAGNKDVGNANYEYRGSTSFQGFDWISKRNFVGIQKIKEHDCLVFRDRQEEEAILDPYAADLKKEMQSFAGDRMEPSPAIGVEVTAYIDMETRLPLFLQIGEEIRTFSYLDPPQTPLSLPQELTTQLAQRQKLWNALTRAASRPF